MGYFEFDFTEEEKQEEKKEIQEKLKQEKKQKKKMKRKEFSEKVKSTYKEVRKEEKARSFTKRHKIFQNNAENYYDPNSKHLTLKYGKVHVLGEFFYHVGKLKVRRKDTATKYVIRNRVLAIVLTGGIVAGTGYAIKKNYDNKTNGSSYIDNKNEKVTLTRVYEIQRGDTLESISEETGISVNKIKQSNQLIEDDDRIYEGDTLALDYIVKSEDLEYYTQEVEVNGMSFAEVITLYRTVPKTLLALNDSIYIEDNMYKIKGDTVIVPNFITQEEFKELKNSNKKLVK